MSFRTSTMLRVFSLIHIIIKTFIVVISTSSVSACGSTLLLEDSRMVLFYKLDTISRARGTTISLPIT